MATLLDADLAKENDTLASRVAFLENQLNLMHLAEAKLNAALTATSSRLDALKTKYNDLELLHNSRLKRSVSQQSDAHKSLPLVIVIIDACNLPFNTDLIKPDYVSGRSAATQIADAVSESLEYLCGTIKSAPYFKLGLFLLMDHPTRFLADQSIALTFEKGYASAHNSYIVIGDSVTRKQKTQELLELFADLQQVKAIYLGGQAPPPLFRSDSRASLPAHIRQKLVLVQPSDRVATFDNLTADELQNYSRIAIPRLFDNFNGLDPNEQQEGNTSVEPSPDLSFASTNASDSGVSLLDDSLVFISAAQNYAEASATTLFEPPSKRAQKLFSEAGLHAPLPSTSKRSHVTEKSSSRRSRQESTSRSRQRIPKSPTSRSSSSIKHDSSTLQIDPRYALSKQRPKICNQFYLTKRGCLEHRCKYSHAYKLTSAQVLDLRQGALTTPCYYEQGNGFCPDPECPYGHRKKA